MKGAMTLKWIKWHGAGNDFLIGDWSALYAESAWQALIAKISHRHFGIGADGVMLVAPSQDPECAARMLYYNSDGSRAAMCGNGIRCFAAHLHRQGMVKEGSFKVLTDDGPKDVCLSVSEEGYKIKISMGAAVFGSDQIPTVAEKGYMIDEEIEVSGKKFKATALRVGVPHLVIEVETLQESEIRTLGPLIEKHPLFPQKINVNVVKQVNAAALEVVTWERGAGLTLACGTGACASFYAFLHAGKTERSGVVTVPGGVLEISVDDKEEIFMTGPAVAVAEVETFEAIK